VEVPKQFLGDIRRLASALSRHSTLYADKVAAGPEFINDTHSGIMMLG
jgi:hypothetical protein